MEGKFQAPKLSLRKETITKLSDDQMKKVIGGAGSVIEQPVVDSCGNNSCNSKGTGSCDDHSCNC